MPNLFGPGPICRSDSVPDGGSGSVFMLHVAAMLPIIVIFDSVLDTPASGMLK
jgi:hypothetical protein